MLYRFATLSSRYHLVVLLLLWLAMQLFLFQFYGIKIVFDSKRYLYIVNQLLNGSYQPEGNLSYFSYILFIAAFFKAGLSVKAVIAAQVLLSAAAAFCLYRLTHTITQNQAAAFVATLLYISWPDLQCWNFYIHTESVFTSLSIVVLYLLVQPYRPRNLAFLVPLLLIILFLRPNGFMLWLAAAAFFMVKLMQQNPAKGKLFFRVMLVVGLPLFALLANAILYNIRNIFSFTKYFANGEILQGYTGWIIRPDTPFQPPADNQPIIMLIEMIWLNGTYIFELMAWRLITYVSQLRPYYTDVHNLVVMLFMYPVYVLAVYALFTNKKMASAKAFIVTLLMVQTGITLLSAVDWDNRFMVPLLPFIFILSGIGAGKLFARKFATDKVNSAFRPPLHQFPAVP